MGRCAELLDVFEVAAVDDGEHSKQSLEDRHRGFLKVFRVSRVCCLRKTTAANRGMRGGGVLPVRIPLANHDMVFLS